MLSTEVLPYSLAVLKAVFISRKGRDHQDSFLQGSHKVNEARKAFCARSFRLENRVGRWAQGEARCSSETAERVSCARVRGY